MTLVNITLTSDSVSGDTIPAKGLLRFTPTRRRTDGDEVVLPIPFTAPLVAGVVAVELEPTADGWAWRIDEHITGPAPRTIYANIPDVEAIPYADLVAIDPTTLQPTAELTPAWVAVITELQASVNAGALTPDPDDPGFFLIGAS